MGKRARRNGGRTTNKRRSVNDVRERYRKTVPFASDKVRKAWDFSKTVNQNYRACGLIGGKMNDMRYAHERRTPTEGAMSGLVDKSTLMKKDELARKTIEWKDASSVASLKEQLDARKPSHRGANFMSVLECAYIQPLVEKHSTRYNIMARDLKLNYNQWTRSKLERRCERYAKWVAEQAEKEKEEDESYEKLMAEDDEEEGEDSDDDGNDDSDDDGNDDSDA